MPYPTRPVGDYPPLVSLRDKLPVRRGPPLDTSGLMRMRMEEQQRADRQQKEQEAKRERDLGNLMKAAELGDPKIVEEFARAYGIDSSLVPPALSVAKMVGKSKKEQQDEKTVAGRREDVKAIGEGHGSRLASGVSPEESLGAARSDMSALAGKVPVRPEELARLRALGYAQADKLGYERGLKGTEAERTNRQLETGMDLNGKPLTPSMRARLKTRINKLNSSNEMKFPGMSFSTPDGTQFHFGDTAKASFANEMADRLTDVSMSVDNLTELRDLLESNIARAGLSGQFQRTGGETIGALLSLADATGMEGLRNFSMDVYSKIEDDFRQKKPGVTQSMLEEADEHLSAFEKKSLPASVLSGVEKQVGRVVKAPSFLLDPGAAEVEALEFFMLYDIARTARGKGFRGQQDIKNVKKTYGIAGFRSPRKVVGRLNKAIERLSKEQATLESRVKGSGGVVVKPTAGQLGAKQEAEAFWQRFVEGGQ